MACALPYCVHKSIWGEFFRVTEVLMLVYTKNSCVWTFSDFYEWIQPDYNL